MTDEEGLRKADGRKEHLSLLRRRSDGRQHAYRAFDPVHDAQALCQCRSSSLRRHRRRYGTIGDPSGRKTERQLQTLDTIKNNAEKLKAQFTHLFGDSENITFVNNYDWLSQIGLLEFLRDYGKLFSVNIMLSKEVVASRLEAAFPLLNFLTRSSSPSTLNTSFQRTTSSFRSAVPISGGTLRPGSIRSARCMAAKLKPLA